jgi:hypothetical protein
MKTYRPWLVEKENRQEVRCNGTLVRFCHTRSGAKMHIHIPGTADVLCSRRGPYYLGTWSAEIGTICARCQEIAVANGWNVTKAEEAVERDNIETRRVIDGLCGLIRGDAGDADTKPFRFPQEIPPLESV